MATVSEVTARPASGLNHIDALLESGPGWNWLTPQRTVIYYTFSLAAPDPSLDVSRMSGSPLAFNAAQQAAAEAALARVSAITGVRFSLTGDATQADLHFAAGNLVGANLSGLASWSFGYTSRGNEVVSYRADAWIYLDNAEFAAGNNNPVVGGTGFEVLLHEIGHAMGLKHPFEDSITLPAALDNTANTLMSYNHVGGPYSDYNAFDRAALLFLYGGDGLGGALGIGAPGRMLIGSAASETLLGGPGNDLLEGGGGDDQLQGGAGLDLARYAGTRAGYAIAALGTGGLTVRSLVGDEGRDQLAGVERLRFADVSVAFDLDGAAGHVARVIGALFGPAAVANPRYASIGLALADGGLDLRALTAYALEAGFGRTPEPAAVVQALYTNLAGAPPSPADLAYWVGTISSGQYTPLSLAVFAAEHPLNAAAIDLVGLTQAGLPYLP